MALSARAHAILFLLWDIWVLLVAVGEMGCNPMSLVEAIREQASALRLLATYLEAYRIRDDLLRLAERCEELAEVEREVTERGSRAISG